MDTPLRLPSFLEDVPDIVYALDGAGLIAAVNRAVEGLLGYRPDELVGRPALELVHPEDRERVRASCTVSATAGASHVGRMELRLVDRQGGTRHFEVNRRLTLAHGAVVRHEGIARDVTDRRALEAHLYRYREIIAHSEDPVVIFGPDGGFMEQNPAHRRLLGYADADLAGQTAARFLGAAAYRTIQHAIGTAGLYRGEIAARTRAGAELTVELLAFAIRSTSGELLCSVGFGRDVTARRRQEERQEVVRRVRETVWEMRDDTDIDRVIAAIAAGLTELGVEYRNCGINVVEMRPDGPLIRARSMVRGGGWLSADAARSADLVAGWWRDGQVVYRPDLEADDPYGERVYMQRRAPIRAVIDVPFSHGTLAVSSTRANAFDAANTALLQQLAGVLSEGFRRMQDLRQLALSEQRYRTLVETPDFVVMQFGLDKRLLYVSPQIGAWLQYTPEELYADPALRVQALHAADRPRLDACLDQALAGQAVHGLEYRWQTRDGQWRWAAAAAFPTHDSAGAVHSVQVVIQDITERKNREQERSIIQLVREAVWRMRTMDDMAEVLARIRAGLEQLGLPVLGCSLNLVDTAAETASPAVRVHEVDAEGRLTISEIDAGADIIRRIWRRQQLAYRPDLETEDPHGEREDLQRYARIRAVIDVPFSAGTLAANSLVPHAFSAEHIAVMQELVAVLAEGCRRLESLRHLADTQSQLMRSEKMAALGNLMAGIAHEINTPVGAVHSMHDTLVRAVQKLKATIETDFPDDVAGNQALQKALQVIEESNRVIESGTRRVTAIVRSLRNFARMDDERRERVDLHAGLEDTLMLVYHDIKNRIEIVRNYGDIPAICCSPGRLNQVFLNILTNAQQAIPGKGRITISTSRVGAAVHVDIADTGMGIAPEHRERIFEAGFTTKDPGHGTGLGLSICQQIVAEHGGHLEVESTVGVGSTFRVVLPVPGECGG